MPKIINLQVIWTNECRGEGTEESPNYLVYQLFTPDGVLICETGPQINGKFAGYVNYDWLFNPSLL